MLAVGSTATFTYVVTNTGNLPLGSVTVRDDNGTPANPSDDFAPQFLSGDTNNNGRLDPGEIWQYRATGTAVEGQYANTASVTVGRGWKPSFSISPAEDAASICGRIPTAPRCFWWMWRTPST